MSFQCEHIYIKGMLYNLGFHIRRKEVTTILGSAFDYSVLFVKCIQPELLAELKANKEIPMDFENTKEFYDIVEKIVTDLTYEAMA